MIQVYGFGSYFNGTDVYQDIDILIVHDSTAHSSCLETISLKESIAEKIEKVDISILSKSAECQFNFIEKSQATLLLEFAEGYREPELIKIIQKVHAYRKHN